MKFPFVSAAMLALAVSACSITAKPASPLAHSVATGWVAQQAPGFYRFRLGDFRITVLSDGTAPRDLPKIMSKPEAVRAAFTASHQALPVELSINAYLIDTGEKRILVDTGAGVLFGPSSGYLVANLHAGGYSAEDIDVILLTHIHGDHSGGLSIGGKPVFPKAIVYVDRRDPAHWLSAEEEAKAPANRRTTFVQSHQTVDPYVRAGRLQTFDGPTELFPGIRTVPEYGHTPGLTGYMLESEGKQLLLWGDIIHAAEVQFADPTLTIDYDVDPVMAIATRQRVLQGAARQGYLVGGAHLSFPGIGHVRFDNGRYAWVPAPYQAKP
ncbi:MBL fold metallo-hydrolase [Dongia soli]|uniref:MBL fold metallo-hydrolase n=1 Tax=Dongia soli TaxID=600628 RepID=A0ABU5E8A0_9PROT|nr:MBL fold metallo-hydrolase [Dongia soli]MDY0882434.1 MBL fold metallo-hydrolase [Dongia soli]